MENKPQPKKEWTKPELLVLVRSKPEEAVLMNCKFLTAGSGPTNADATCIMLCEEVCSNPLPS